MKQLKFDFEEQNWWGGKLSSSNIDKHCVQKYYSSSDRVISPQSILNSFTYLRNLENSDVENFMNFHFRQGEDKNFFYLQLENLLHQ